MYPLKYMLYNTYLNINIFFLSVCNKITQCPHFLEHKPYPHLIFFNKTSLVAAD